MFGIGMPEMLLICAIALIVIGPKKLPELAKTLGKAFGEFKKATSDLKDSFEIDSDYKDITNTIDDVGTEIKDGVDSTLESTDPTESESVSVVQNEDDDETAEASSEAADEPTKEPGESEQTDELKTYGEPDMPSEQSAPESEKPDATTTEATAAAPEETQKDDRG
jgi:Tat protein translocase TatB subunit